MIVECPNCSTRFSLEPTEIGDRGAKVRCSVCQHSFVVPAPSVDLVNGDFDGPNPTLAIGDLEIPEADAATGAFGVAPTLDNVSSGDFTEDTVVAGIDLLETGELQEIGADDFEELSAEEAELGNETVPGISISDLSDNVELPEPDAFGFSQTDANHSFDALSGVDPFASPAAEPQSASNTVGSVANLPGDPAQGFDHHSTAVYNIAQLAQIAQSPEEPDLSGDIPGGLGENSEDPEPPGPRRTMRRFDGATRARAIASAAVTALMVLGLAIGTLFTLVQTGRLNPSVLGLERAIPIPAEEPNRGYKDVFPITLRSVIYPSRLGTDLLVFRGWVHNRTNSERADLDVLARVLDSKGQVVASTRAPVGVVFDVVELNDIADRGDVQKLVDTKLEAGLGRPLGGNEKREYMAVLPSPPENIGELEHQVVVVPRPKLASLNRTQSTTSNDASKTTNTKANSTKKRRRARRLGRSNRSKR